MRTAVAASVVGKSLEMVTLLLLATVVPRVLGPSAYGRFSVPLTVVTLGSLALTLGGTTLMARYVPAAAPAERVAVARAIAARLAKGRALQLGAVAGLAGLLVIADPDGFPALETTLVVVALVLNVATTIALQMGLGLGRTGAWSLRYPLQNSVLIAAVLVLHPSGTVGHTTAIVAAAAVGAGFAAFVVAPVLGPPVQRVAVPHGAIRFGVLQAVGAALVQFSHRGGVLAVAVLAGSAAETGYVALATGIGLGVTYAVLQTFTVSLPHLAGDEASLPGSEAVLRRLAGWLLAVLVPAAVVAALALDRLVPLVFGEGYGDATAAFGPALGLVVLAPLNALAVQAAALRFQPRAAAVAGAASAVAFVGVALVAVPAWGAAGGTTAALAGAAAGAAVSLRLLPGAAGGRVSGASFAGAGFVIAVATLASS